LYSTPTLFAKWQEADEAKGYLEARCAFLLMCQPFFWPIGPISLNVSFLTFKLESSDEQFGSNSGHFDFLNLPSGAASLRQGTVAETSAYLK
jgi:hypothetical protein